MLLLSVIAIVFQKWSWEIFVQRCSVVKRFAYKSLDPYGGTTRRREIEKSSRAQPGPSFAAAPITNPR